MPVAVKAVRIVREEDQARFEHTDERQDQDVGDENCEKEVQEATMKGFS